MRWRSVRVSGPAEGSRVDSEGWAVTSEAGAWGLGSTAHECPKSGKGRPWRNRRRVSLDWSTISSRKALAGERASQALPPRRIRRPRTKAR